MPTDLGPKYAFGYEWTNSRKQVFVQLGDAHPMARKDGFYARAKFVMEEALKANKVKPFDQGLDGTPAPGSGPWVDAAMTTSQFSDSPFLAPNNRVLHLDGDPGNDDPTNLILFESQKALAQFRSQQYHASKDQNYRDRLKGLTDEQKERRAVHGTERAQQMEKRSAAAKRAHARRKAAEKTKQRETQ